jgi:hypothetical protein
MPLETAIARPTRFQTLVIAASAKLDEILEAEERAAPTTAFGKIAWDESMRAPRICWMHVGGSFTLEPEAPPVAPDEDEAPVPPLGFRVARTQVALWHITPEHVEHMLDRLWLATKSSAGGEAFRWQRATYDYPSEQQGEAVQSGLSVIVLNLPTELAVAGSFDGEIEAYTITDTQIRSGIESPVDEPIGDTAYEVNDWVTPKVTSES